MPKVNFPEVEDADNFTPIPTGDYPCKVIEVKKEETRNGDEMWVLKLEVLSGTYKGRHIFDRLFFSEKAMPRLKLICSKLGLDVTQELDLKPSDLHYKEAIITVLEGEYIDDNNVTKKNNTVPFAGYERIDQEKSSSVNSSSASNDDDLPF